MGDDRTVRLRLMWTLQAQFAGYVCAMSELSDRGVELRLLERGGVSPVSDVARGATEFGVASPWQVLSEPESASRVRVVAVFQQDSSIALVGLRERVDPSLRAMPSAKVGIWAGESVEVQLMLARAGVSMDRVDFVPVGDSAEPLLNGEVDLLQVTTYNELLRLTDAGVDLIVHRPSEYGLALVKDGLITSLDLIENEPDLVAQFVSASVRGWDRALMEPASAVDMLLAIDHTLDSREQTQQLVALRELIRPDDVELGFPDPEHFSRSADALAAVGMNVGDGLAIRDARFWEACREGGPEAYI